MVKRQRSDHILDQLYGMHDGDGDIRASNGGAAGAVNVELTKAIQRGRAFQFTVRGSQFSENSFIER